MMSIRTDRTGFFPGAMFKNNFLSGETKGEKRSVRDLFINGCLAIFSFIIILILGELFLRTVYPFNVIPDAYLGERGRPGARWDQNGFRNGVIVDQAEIVALGDSLTEGFNAEMSEAWPQVLAKLSGQTVYNMGFSDYGPVQYYYLADKALSLNPDMIIIGFYLGNDLVDAFESVYDNENWKGLRTRSFLIDQNRPAASTDPAGAVLSPQFGCLSGSLALEKLKIHLWLNNHSRLYSFYINSVQSLKEKLGLNDDKEKISEETEKCLSNNQDLGFIYKQGKIKTVLNIRHHLEAVDIKNEKVEEGYRITKELFSRIDRRLKRVDKKLIITILPTKEYIYGSYFKENKISTDVSEAFWARWGKEDELKNNFLNFCSVSDLSCVDVSSKMVAALDNDTKIYSETLERHPTASGYQATAEMIWEYLREKHFAF